MRAWLAMSDVVKVTEDGGVVKTILKKGNGELNDAEAFWYHSNISYLKALCVRRRTLFLLFMLVGL